MAKVQTLKKVNKSESILKVSRGPIIKSKLKTQKKPKSSVRKGRRVLTGVKRGKGKGVVYLSHIPHGFYEEQIETYFSQFGKVTGVSLPRSKTGRARGYAFVEFKHSEVADIVAETMNNYLMFNRLLKAKSLPLGDQKPGFFLAAKTARDNHKTSADRIVLAVKHNRKLKNRHLKSTQETKLAAKLLRKKKALQKRLVALGVNYDFLVNKSNIQAIFKRQKEMKGKGNMDLQNSPLGTYVKPL